MSNILTARVTIKGRRPLLWHHFGPEALPLEKQERSGVPGNDPDEWRQTCLALPDRRLYLDPTYIFGCIRDGGRYVKKGRGSIQSALTATLSVMDDMVILDRVLPEAPTADPTAPVYLDIRGVRNPSTKGRNVRYRIAASAGWVLTFNLSWDKTVVSRQEMQSAIIEAGRLAGIGSGRAIGMGRFEIVTFEVSESVASLAA